MYFNCKLYVLMAQLMYSIGERYRIEDGINMGSVLPKSTKYVWTYYKFYFFPQVRFQNLIYDDKFDQIYHQAGQCLFGFVSRDPCLI